MTTNAPQRLAVVVLALEGLLLAIIAGWETVALAAGDSEDTGTSVALIVLTVLGVAGVLAFAVGTARGRSWGRSGGVVTQLLFLAVAVGALSGPAPAPGFAALVAAPGVVGLVLLVLTARRAGARERASNAREGDPGSAR